MRLHHVVIKPVDPSKPMNGFNTRIELDGKELKGVRRVQFDLEAGHSLANLVLEMDVLADIEAVSALVTVLDEDSKAVSLETPV